MLRFYCFHIQTTLRDWVFFSCGSYISLYIISMFQKFDCQLHVGKNKQGVTVTKLFLKLKYIFMCIWLFIAESTFYRQHIKCYLSCFRWGFLASPVCVFGKNPKRTKTYSLSVFPSCSCVIILLVMPRMVCKVRGSGAHNASAKTGVGYFRTAHTPSPRCVIPHNKE